MCQFNNKRRDGVKKLGTRYSHRSSLACLTGKVKKKKKSTYDHN